VSISAKMGCARAIRARLEFAENLRDLAHFNVAIDSKLSGCDLVNADQVRELVSVIQSKTKRPVQFELTQIQCLLWAGTGQLTKTIGCPLRAHFTECSAEYECLLWRAIIQLSSPVGKRW